MNSLLILHYLPLLVVRIDASNQYGFIAICKFSGSTGRKKGDHFGDDITSGTICGSFQGWGSFRGRDHFEGPYNTNN